MRDNVISDLGRYAETLESLSPPVTVDEVLTRPGLSPEGPPKDVRRGPTPGKGLLVALGASALTLVFVGGISLFGLFRSGPVPADSAADPVVWALEITPDFEVPGVVRDVLRTSAGLIAVGSAQEEGRFVPAIWIHVQGSAWQRVRVPEFEGFSGELRTVAEHTGRIVVVGIDAERDVLAVWYSETGVDWNRVYSDALGPKASEVHDAIVNLDAAYVVVGSDVWRSPDGLEWERTDLDGTGLTLMEFPDGVLVGGIDDSGDHAAMWLSTDLGVRWSALPVHSDEGLYDRSAIRAVGQTDDGFLAVGYVGSGQLVHPAVWISADGYEWDLVWVAEDSIGELTEVATSSGHIVALGEIDGQETFWLSDNAGLDWDEYRGRPGLMAVDPGGIESLVVSGDGALIAGGQSAGQPSVWLGTAQAPSQQTGDDTAPPIGLTCEARIENGASWEPGVWDQEGRQYQATGTTPCLDLLPDHYMPQQWKVEWQGKAERLEVGFLARFETGIHGSVYTEMEIRSEAGEWITPQIEPSPNEPFTFVAMPHSFDQWTEISWTVTPCGEAGCR